MEANALTSSRQDLWAAAQAHAQNKEYEEAEKILAPLWDTLPNDLNLADFYCNVLLALGKNEELLDVLRYTLSIRPTDAATLTIMATTYERLRDWDQAAFCFGEAVKYNPHNPVARWLRAMFLLKHGDTNPDWWFDGLRDYQYVVTGVAQVGMTNAGIALRSLQPQWDGKTAKDGDKLYICHEQGMGDSIQMVRYVKAIKERFPKLHITLECPQELVRLYRTLWGPDRLVVLPAKGGFSVDFDHWTMIMRLPLLVGTIPPPKATQAPYLFVDRPETRPVYTKFVVGVAWKGNPIHPSDEQRSIPWETFRRIHGEICFRGVPVNLQYKDEEGMPGTSIQGDYLATARRIASCDLVICCDTSVAHLAGAMGKDVWCLIAHDNDWRWFLEREDSPWYPSLRLFRQQTPGDWEDVVARVVTALKERTSKA